MIGWRIALEALAPTVVVGLIFWYVMRAVINADRAERRAAARIDPQDRPDETPP
jgi:hypothetical protein